ncbi:CTDP1 [Cordylochernes scorpioides]|uniref:protein-serine/threonine phosphatase n=1 Tax=Cordylochernes scorpioides TaxID=51811 RepID=A0ABY6K545_9ARAC|nr:CTDP1 [Cordylochernes scorpioides]
MEIIRVVSYVPKFEGLELSKVQCENLLKRKKLILLVDLDQTLIYFDVETLKLTLRPGCQDFLKKLSKYFFMIVCTKGTYRYAYNVVELLDPEEKYFGKRIISREFFRDESKKEVMHRLFKAYPQMVVAIDDRKTCGGENLLNIPPFEPAPDYSLQHDHWLEVTKVKLLQLHCLFFENVLYLNKASEKKTSNFEVKELLKIIRMIEVKFTSEEYLRMIRRPAANGLVRLLTVKCQPYLPVVQPGLTWDGTRRRPNRILQHLMDELHDVTQCRAYKGPPLRTIRIDPVHYSLDPGFWRQIDPNNKKELGLELSCPLPYNLNFTRSAQRSKLQQRSTNLSRTNTLSLLQTANRLFRPYVDVGLQEHN